MTSNLPDGTPSSERLHIIVLGKRNSGKSSLVNAMTGQETSVVSAVPGTTTDPVRKAMEISGIGPCLFIDTAGFDDIGEVGEMRVGGTLKAVGQADIAIFVFKVGVGEMEGCEKGYECDADERLWLGILKEKGIPVIPVINHGSDEMPAGCRILADDIRKITGETPVIVNAVTGSGVRSIFKAILGKIPEDFGAQTITGDMVSDGDCVMLVMPQDIQAPKGRLILPQVQTLRELLDRHCQVVCCTPENMQAALDRLSCPPDLIITDSQAFGEVWRMRPEGSRLTSFSILFAAYKGDLQVFYDGARHLDRLDGSARILIAEACTHAPASEDIGRVKIPRMLRQRLGEGISIDIAAGKDFPADLSCYDIIIHCGACMFNRKYVMDRIASATGQEVHITNYGMTIAWAKGILDKVIPIRPGCVSHR